MLASEKITSEEILEAILSDIRSQLLKNSTFGNPSLAFSGCRYQFGIRCELMSRGEVKVEQSMDRTIGKTPAGAEVTLVEKVGDSSISRKRPRTAHPPQPESARDGHTA